MASLRKDKAYVIPSPLQSADCRQENVVEYLLVAKIDTRYYTVNTSDEN